MKQSLANCFLEEHVCFSCIRFLQPLHLWFFLVLFSLPLYLLFYGILHKCVIFFKKIIFDNCHQMHVTQILQDFVQFQGYPPQNLLEMLHLLSGVLHLVIIQLNYHYCVFFCCFFLIVCSEFCSEFNLRISCFCNLVVSSLIECV